MNPTNKTIVIMGPTGSGKSKLSIDLTSRFFTNSEIINSDKIQLYNGLNITTNKITLQDQLGVTHHLLGSINSSSSVTPFEFRSLASRFISNITSRKKLPFIVGGSNSLIYALLSKKFNPNSNIFHDPKPDTISPNLQYNCCFIYVHVELPILNQYLKKRVDEMLDSGMLQELENFYESGAIDSVSRTGLRQAIGIPELEKYIKYTKCTDFDKDAAKTMYDDAIKEIKENTCQLAKRQVEKIQRLREIGWDLQKIDATEVFTASLNGERVGEIWERDVVEPSVKIVKRFLEE
ncbi:Adenylate isopentenyltransferase [Heracleum sosnowskyi]|uniref:Adenylate isopentenyltransferase n=1 Tax=Heracleum sosnowskyi TaxID=360622 RepID=A0AAD8I858_9APIA|nr:Adenylate isopentenyltransferase [Heracleum sosnowskyi]